MAPVDHQPTSFDELYAVASRRLIHQVYAMTGDLTEAQDCVQEAFARAWQRWPQVSSYDDPEAWVRTVARRIAVSRWRRTRTALTHLVRHGRPDSVPPPSEDLTLLVSALRHIPRAQREAIVLHHLVGLSVEEVAAQTGSPAGTVKARLHRGRAALATVIGDLSPSDELDVMTRRSPTPEAPSARPATSTGRRSDERPDEELPHVR